MGGGREEDIFIWENCRVPFYTVFLKTVSIPEQVNAFLKTGRGERTNGPYSMYLNPYLVLDLSQAALVFGTEREGKKYGVLRGASFRNSNIG